MKSLLLTLSLSLAALPIHADEMTPTRSKDGADLPPPRISTPKPAPAAMPAEPAPVVSAPVETPPPPKTVEVASPPPVVAPALPAETAPAMPAKVAPAALAPVTPAGDTGWLAGAGLGYSSNRDYECTGCGAAIGSLDDTGFAYKLFGGYRFGKHVAVQGGYLNLADTKAAGVAGAWNDKLEVDGFYAAVQGILPINQAFDVFATAGLLRWDQKVTYNGGSGSFDGTDLMYGLGASYALNKTGAKVQLEWNRMPDVGTNDPTYGHKDDYDLFTVNLVYQF